MPLVTKVRLFRSNYTICYMSEDLFVLPDKKYYDALGVEAGDSWQIDVERCDGDRKAKSLKLVVNALFLRPFVRECLNSKVFRTNVISHLNERCGNPENGTAFLKLILEPPDKELIDYTWSDRILRLVWSRVEIENAFSWLSTLGGAYSALGDYFEDCVSYIKLNYGLLIWGNSVDIQRAFIVQKKCIRAACNVHFLEPCRPLFKATKVLPLPCMYIKQMCLLIKDHPDYFNEHSQFFPRTARHKDKLQLPLVKLNVYGNNAFCMAIKIYNKLPKHIKECHPNKFKSEITEWLLNKCFYSVKEYLNPMNIQT